MKNMVSGAKLSMEQVKLRLDTVSELGDVVVTLSPCMSIIKGLAPSLNGIMPEANASMQDLSSILGDVMSGSSVELGDTMSVGTETNADTLAILEEAQGVITGQTKHQFQMFQILSNNKLLRENQTFSFRFLFTFLNKDFLYSRNCRITVSTSSIVCNHHLPIF